MPQKKRGRPVAEDPKIFRLDIRVTKFSMTIANAKALSARRDCVTAFKPSKKCKGSGATLAKVLRRFPPRIPKKYTA